LNFERFTDRRLFFNPAIVKLCESPGKAGGLPLHSIKAAVTRLANEDGTSINQFVVMAVVEKIAALETASFFTERRQRADPAAFRKLMHRKGSEPPRRRDEIPPSVRKVGQMG
jgi:hypothetical protein